LPGKTNLNKTIRKNEERKKIMRKNISLSLALTFVIAGLFASSKVQAQEAATTKVKAISDTSNLYDQIMSDPRNRKHLELGKQGWISGPGDNTFLRFGGFVQVNFIRDFQNTGYSFGEFMPSVIPVPTEYTPSLTFDPRTTRITFETQTDTKKGMVNTFIEMDFSGFAQKGSIQPRLRQAYVAWINAKKRQSLMVGQATTTFTDGDIWPESFDLEGPNAMTYLRQVIIRYSFMLSRSDKWIGSLAFEEPLSSVQYGKGLEEFPDIIFTTKWKEKWGHLRFGALGRLLIAESISGTGKAENFAWGLSLSGQVMVPYRHDNFQFQMVGGQGTGRYMMDLGAASIGQDAVYDSLSITLTPLDAYGGFVAYQHWWMDNLRTNVVGGYVNLMNQPIQESDALNETIYVVANTIYSPFNRFDIGLEYYYGQRINKNTNAGHANRLMLVVKYSF
jgi:hypothetical protein